MMKREGEDVTGKELDFNKINKGGADVAEIKAYLATEDKKAMAKGHKNYVETGGG